MAIASTSNDLYIPIKSPYLYQTNNQDSSVSPSESAPFLPLPPYRSTSPEPNHSRQSYRRPSRPCSRCLLSTVVLGLVVFAVSQVTTESKREAIHALVSDKFAEGWKYWDWDRVDEGLLGGNMTLYEGLGGGQEEGRVDEVPPLRGEEVADEGHDHEEEELGASEVVQVEEEEEKVEEKVKVEEGPGQIPIKVLPLGRKAQDAPNYAETKYLGYLPHSGFHNQRMELENALLLAKLSNRTLLLPPIWIGQPIARQLYDDLSRTWTDMYASHGASFGLPNTSTSISSPLFTPLTSLYTLSSTLYPHPRSSSLKKSHAESLASLAIKNREKWLKLGYELTKEGYPITNLTRKECKSRSWECRHLFRDSFVAWEWLVDLDGGKRRGAEGVGGGGGEGEGGEGLSGFVDWVDRWDVRERALEELLEVKPEDYYIFEDEVIYDYKIIDGGTAEGPLMVADETPGAKYARRVSLPAFNELPHRVVLFGSVFGSGRILTSNPEVPKWRQTIAQSMVFRNPHLIKPAEAIRERLGGINSYVAVHARVGDGVFRTQAKTKMEQTFTSLLRRMKVGEEAESEIREYVRDRKIWGRSLVFGSLEGSGSDWSWLDEEVEENEGHQGEEDDSAEVGEVASFLSLIKRAPIPPRPLDRLQCRNALHTSPTLLAFNTPLYLATDSRSPSTDPNLRSFFRAFPCTFILSDFEEPQEINEFTPVKEVGEMFSLVNELDGEKIGHMLLPFLEAVVVAKARTVMGTPGSTFSGFATGLQHKVYSEEEQ